jgi:hypothetical protein
MDEREGTTVKLSRVLLADEFVLDARTTISKWA